MPWHDILRPKMDSRLSPRPYYRANSSQSIARGVAISLAVASAAILLFSNPAALSAQHLALELLLERGHFSEAIIHLESLDDTNSSTWISAANTINKTRGSLPRWQQEHLLRLALENVLELRESAAEPDNEMTDHLAELEPILLQVSAFESPQLRRTIFELGAEIAEGGAWRSELQRRGEQLVDELERSGGRPGADVVEESLALLRALAATGESRLTTLVERIRRESRVRAIVESAREATDALREGR